MAATRIPAAILMVVACSCLLAERAWARPDRQVESLARTAWDHVDELDLEFDRNFRPAAEYRLLLNTTDRMLDLLEDIEDDAARGQRWDRIECRLNEAASRSHTLQVTLDRMDARYAGCARAWRGARPYCSQRARTLLFAVDTMIAQLQAAVVRLQSCDRHQHRGPSHAILPAPVPVPLPPPAILPHRTHYRPQGATARHDDRFNVNFGVHHGQPVISFGNSSFAIRLGGR